MFIKTKSFLTDIEFMLSKILEKFPGILCKTVEGKISHILKLGFFYKIIISKSCESEVTITLDGIDNFTLRLIVLLMLGTKYRDLFMLKETIPPELYPILSPEFDLYSR